MEQVSQAVRPDLEEVQQRFERWRAGRPNEARSCREWANGCIKGKCPMSIWPFKPIWRD